MRNQEIKAERVRHGLTQKEFAGMMGMDVRNYRAKESGYRRFSPDEIMRIARFFMWPDSKIVSVYFRE